MISLHSVLRGSSGTLVLPMEDMVHLIQRTLLHADADMFPNIRLLIEVGCMLPVSSTEAERSFSVLRRSIYIIEWEEIALMSIVLKVPTGMAGNGSECASISGCRHSCGVYYHEKLPMQVNYSYIFSSGPKKP